MAELDVSVSGGRCFVVEWSCVEVVHDFRTPWVSDICRVGS